MAAVPRKLPHAVLSMSADDVSTKPPAMSALCGCLMAVPTRRRHSPIRLAAAKVPVDRERSDLKDLIRRDYSPTSRPPQARTGALAQLPGEPQLHVIIARKQAVRSRLV